MKRIYDQFRQGRAQVQSHKFFAWLNSDGLPLARRFVFAPVMIDFIMGFADMNKWFLSYADPQTDPQRAINQHTEEDRTHSRLFYEDWYELDLAEASSWAPGKVLWWLFLCRESGIVRRFGMEILELAVTRPDPQVRFSMMEAIEICGDVFFGQTAPIAESMSRHDGFSHRYFGHYHRERETGHLHADERVFHLVELTPAQRAEASLTVAQIFDTFLSVLDQLLSYAQRASDDPLRLFQSIECDYALAYDCRTLHGQPRVRPPPFSLTPVEPAATQRSIVARLHERATHLRAHRLLGWLRTADASPRSKLQSFVAVWGIDTVGYKDFNELVLGYRLPQSTNERALNRWTDILASHAALYVRDWRTLGMDDLLRWDAGQTIAFYFLSEQTEVHRRNMAAIKKLAFRNRPPILRWWLLRAIESAGETLFERTAELAAAVEQEFGVALDYWGYRHDTASDAQVAIDLGARFLQEKMTPEECDVAHRMIDLVFDNMQEQFSLSYTMATEQLFLVRQEALPPPRPRSITLASATHR